MRYLLVAGTKLKSLYGRGVRVRMLTSALVSNDVLFSLAITWKDEGVSPANSYRVLLGDDGDLYWVTRDDGQQIRYDKHPPGTFGRRFAMGFIAMLPVENQLQADWSTATPQRVGGRCKEIARSRRLG